MMSKNVVSLVCAAILSVAAAEGTSPYIVVDDFDSYAGDGELRAVWYDGLINGTDSEIFLETDANFTRDGNSMRYEFTNSTTAGGKLIGSAVDADPIGLESGRDWTAGGVKALTLYLIGDPCNRTITPTDSKGNNYLMGGVTPWVEVEDASSNTGWVAYESPTDMFYDYMWFEWNIDLGIFDACGVTLSAIERLTIGIGGDRVGQFKSPSGGEPGYLHIDDIRLYPPRCVPEVSELAGDLTADCSVDYFDVNVMAADWLIADGCVTTSQQNGTLTAAGDPNWTSGQIDGALGFDPNIIEVDVNDPCLMGLTHMSITAWIYRDGSQPYVGIVSSPGQEPGKGTELSIGSDGETVNYQWNALIWRWCNGAWCKFDSGLVVPDQTWTFIAMSVDPDGCSLYMRPAGGTLDSARDWMALGPLEQFDDKFFIGRGCEGAHFFGAIDDVRIYTYALDVNEITYLATEGVDGNEPDPNCPAYHYKFDDGSGLVAVDSGCGALVYRAPMSPANLTDPEPEGSRFVNFYDYDILADNWMEQYLWP